MTKVNSITIRPSDKTWPPCLTERLGRDAPPILRVVGPLSLLAARRTALFSSVKTPGDSILRTLDAARRMRDAGVTVISGFQSPIEKECLCILLRGKQPIIICPARAIDAMRIPTECQVAFDAGRLLFLSPFSGKPMRVTKDSAFRRNEVVAALADEAHVAHITPGGQTVQIANMLKQWDVPLILQS